MAASTGECLEFGTCAGYDFGGQWGTPTGVQWAVRGLPGWTGYEPRNAENEVVTTVVADPNEATPLTATQNPDGTMTITHQPLTTVGNQPPAVSNFIIPALIILAAFAFGK